MTDAMPISKFKATCLRVLDQVKKTGQPILVTRNGEPIALVSPPPPPASRSSWLGCMQDRLDISGDILSPVVEERDWEALQG